VPTADPMRTATEPLEQLLGQLVEAHERLLDLTAEHRGAIARADGGAAQECARRQAEITAHIAALESQRRSLASALLPGTPAPTLSTLARHLPEPSRSRIARIAARLRELIATIQENLRIIRAATSAIVAHMDGLMQQVARALSHAGLYGPRGRLDAAPMAPCGLDLTL
jgi:hypothetical protein